MTTTIAADAGSTTLATIAQPYNLPDLVQNKVVNTLAPFVEQAGVIAREAGGVIVTDASQTEAIAKSRELRLRIAKIRVSADKAKKALKEEYLRPGQFIDAAGRHVLSLIEPVETRLTEQEKIVERQEEAKREATKRRRAEMLQPYGTDWTAYDLAGMSDKAFADLLDGQAALHAQRREAAEREQKARAEAERIRTEQEAATRAENERLRKERDAAEAKAAQERAKAAKALAEANAARLKAEAEAKAIADAQAAKAKTEAAAARKAARAPDKQRVLFFADSIEALPVPTFKDPAMQAVAKDIENHRAGFVAWLRTTAESL